MSVTDSFICGICNCKVKGFAGFSKEEIDIAKFTKASC